MPVWRLQTAIGADENQARHHQVITPHFNDSGVGTDPDGLCEDLATAVAAWVGGNRQVEVRAYDAQGTPPVFPQGEAMVNQGNITPSSCAREVALCLSFYSERNLPRQRGRLFLPIGALGRSADHVRPETSHMNHCATLVPILADLGGADVDWVVYSRTDDEARPVTNWFIDNEWDTIRSRGLDPTSRIEGTVGEG